MIWRMYTCLVLTPALCFRLHHLRELLLQQEASRVYLDDTSNRFSLKLLDSPLPTLCMAAVTFLLRGLCLYMSADLYRSASLQRLFV